jgi:hypothetical protein
MRIPAPPRGGEPLVRKRAIVVAGCERAAHGLLARCNGRRIRVSLPVELRSGCAILAEGTGQGSDCRKCNRGTRTRQEVRTMEQRMTIPAMPSSETFSAVHALSASSTRADLPGRPRTSSIDELQLRHCSCKPPRSRWEPAARPHPSGAGSDPVAPTPTGHARNEATARPPRPTGQIDQ